MKYAEILSKNKPEISQNKKESDVVSLYRQKKSNEHKGNRSEDITKKEGLQPNHAMLSVRLLLSSHSNHFKEGDWEEHRRK